MKFSFIVPLVKNSEYLSKLLDSINHQKFLDEIEIILISDEKLIILDKYNFKIKNCIYKGFPPNKRDFGFEFTKGKIIIFIDDDAYLHRDYIKNLNILYNNIEDKKTCFVGPSLTPDDDNFISRISSYFFSSKFLFYFNERNKIIKKDFYVKDWPTVNFTIHRDIFIKINKFNSNIWPGEDTLFCDKLNRSNFKIKYSGSLYNYHYRRNSFSKLFRQVYRYGLHRGFLLKSLNLNKSNFIFYIFIGLFFLTFASIFLFMNLNLILLLIKVYSFILLLGLLEMLVINKKLIVLFALFLAPFLHFSYFFGLFLGLIKSTYTNHISKLGR